MTPPVDAKVRLGVDRTHQLVAEMERLTHNLNVHLDEVQRLISDRRKTL